MWVKGRAMEPTVVRRTVELAGIDVPVVEITGAHDGPALTVIAGVHGCEYAPMAAVRRWTRELNPQHLRGRVTAVPVGQDTVRGPRGRQEPQPLFSR
jgi:predicted deacylase